jgi:quercetin dioxygenase-like cupin family protein
LVLLLFLLQSLHCGSHAPRPLPVRHRQAIFTFCRSSRSLVRLALMLRFSLLTIRRGGSTPPHEHPGTTYAYVLQGAVVSKLNDGQTQTFTKGQTWTEQPHDHHMISKNASSTEPAKLLVFMIAPHGAELTTFLH